jgi:hypothetical protein
MNPLIHAAIVRAQSAEIAVAADRRRHVALPPRPARAGFAWPRLAVTRLARRPLGQTG